MAPGIFEISMKYTLTIKIDMLCKKIEYVVN